MSNFWKQSSGFTTTHKVLVFSLTTVFFAISCICMYKSLSLEGNNYWLSMAIWSMLGGILLALDSILSLMFYAHEDLIAGKSKDKAEE